MCKPGDNPKKLATEAAAMSRSGGMTETRRVGDHGPWKWIASGLLGLVMFLFGAFAGDFAASIRYSSLSSKVEAHASSEGHPVMIQRVEDMKESLIRIEASIARQGVIMNDKLQRQSIVLREIEQQVTKNGNRR
jgi:hypothetical protein